MKTKFLIFSQDHRSQQIYSLIQSDDYQILGRLSDENRVLEEINKKRIDVLLVSSDDEKAMLRVCQQVYLLRPWTTIIVLASDYSAELLHQLIQVGVHNILPISLGQDKIQAQVDLILQNERSRMLALNSSNNEERKSKVISIFSAKGGVGKSSFATNLAVKLAQKNQKVALLDFDLEFGDLAMLMRLSSEQTIADLIQEMSVPTVDTIRKYMTIHSSGVNLLAAPTSPEYADHLSSSQIDKIINSLRHHYDFLIIDMASGFTEINLTCFDFSSELFFLTTNDVASISRSKKALIILESLIGKERIRLILSNEKPSRISSKNIEQALGYPIWKKISHDEKMIVDSINLGSPYVLTSANSPQAKTIEMISNELTQELDSAMSHQGLKKKERSLMNVFNKSFRKSS